MERNFNNQNNYQQNNYQNQYQQSQQYGCQPQQYNMTQYAQPQPKTRDKGAFGMGIASLALGIASIVLFWVGVFFGIPGIVLGVISKRRQSENNNMAKIGFALSIVGVVLNIICAIVVVALIIWGVTELNSIYSY